MSDKFAMDRRTLLKSIGGCIGVGLPLLDAMFARSVSAQTASAPQRLLVIYCGTAAGSTNNNNPRLIPASFGPLPAQLGLGISSLQAFTNDLSLISNLRIPNGAGSGPAAWEGTSFHEATIGPMMSGRPSTNGLHQPRGITGDVIAAKAFGSQFQHLIYRAQAARYNGHYDYTSAEEPTDAASGRQNPRIIDPIQDPALAYRNLFQNFTPPAQNPPPPATGPVPVSPLVRDRRGILQVAHRASQSLAARLGVSDRRRVQEHLDAISDIESRLVALGQGGQGTGQPVPQTSTATCQKPSAAAARPPVDSSVEGYNDEHERALVMNELIAMAFACDLARVATLQLTCSMPGIILPTSISHTVSGAPLDGTPANANCDIHNFSHGGCNTHYTVSEQNHNHILNWHAFHMAKIMERLKSTPDVTGSLLDNTAIVFLYEGGTGIVGATGDGNSDGVFAPHTSEGMVALVAGSKKFNLGQHIDGAGKHPGQVLLSAMAAASVPSVSALGELSGGVPGILKP